MNSAIPLGLYIHIPWCEKKCPYCDFNSHEGHSDENEHAYVNALIKDIQLESQRVQHRKISSIFFGGGTPSLFSAKSIDKILVSVRQHFNCLPDAEITLESNPGSAEAEKYLQFFDTGVNRLSIGIQSFDDEALQRLGRVHSSQQAHQAIEMAQRAGFKRINLDLMFGLPHQTLTQSLDDVRTALSYHTKHISHYQLTLEKNTLFYKKPPTLPHNELIWDMQNACQELLFNQLSQYEVSAYSTPEHKAVHNLNYWQFGDYIGVGAGAHGKVTNTMGDTQRYWKTKHPKRYIETAGTKKSVGDLTTIHPENITFEFMLNAMRLREGFSQHLFEQRTLLPFQSIQPRLQQLIDKQFLTHHSGTYQCSEHGWNFLNDVVEHFLPQQT